jgi:hypothetical protein
MFFEHNYTCTIKIKNKKKPGKKQKLGEKDKENTEKKTYKLYIILKSLKKKKKNRMSQTFSNAQVYSMPIIALALAISVFISAICIYSAHSAQETTVFESKNGFAGYVNDITNQLIVLITAQKLLKGTSDGSITSATDQDVTGMQLSDFGDSVSTEDNITASDSILSALQKCAILKVTSLSGLTKVFAQISANDTIFEAFQKLFGTCHVLSNLFSMHTPLDVKTTFLTDLWENVTGSCIIPPYYLFPGSNITIKTFGVLESLDFADSATFQFEFLDNPPLIHTALSLNETGDRQFCLEINIFASTGLVSLLSSLSYDIPGNTTGLITRTSVKSSPFVFDITKPTALFLYGKVSGDAIIHVKNSFSITTYIAPSSSS